MTRRTTCLLLSVLVPASLAGAARAADEPRAASAVQAASASSSCARLVASLTPGQFATLREGGAVRLDRQRATSEQLAILQQARASAGGQDPETVTLRLATQRGGIPAVQLWSSDRGRARRFASQPLALSLSRR